MSSVVIGTSQRTQLLLIDDNPADVLLVREALQETHSESLTFELQWVDRLQRALQHIAEKRTDLVLLDLSLPDTQGLATMKRFQAQAPDIPVVVLTGRRDEGTALEALKMGAQDYIIKDELHGKLLTRAIRYALQRTQERKRFESQLFQAQKMDALGRLAGGVAHDFNNLLMIILGHAELHLSELPADSPSRRHLLPIITAADRATALTRQLLAFSRKSANRPQVINVGNALLDLGKMLRRLIDERIEIAITTAPGLGCIKMDPTQIEQVIMNLAINARDAMPNGGKLTIDASNATIGEVDRQWQNPIEPGEYVLITVTDTGTGMDEETRQKIFEPFFTTKPTGEGTGLGLAMVYGIVTQNGGHVWLYSEKNCGTTFRVYLPRVLDQSRSVRRQSSQPVRKGTETILVVEDDQNLRSLVNGLLTEWGYTVLLASDGEQALKISREYAGRIALVITDMIMPGMGGQELIQRIRHHRPDTRYLCMSGYPFETALQNSSIDANFYLQKPFPPSQLSALLRKVFGS